MPCNTPYHNVHFYPLLPNSSFHFSKACNPSLLTLGLTFLKLVTKSSNPIALISSRFVVNSASPNDRNGPIAASFVSAVISDPEKPIISNRRPNGHLRLKSQAVQIGLLSTCDVVCLTRKQIERVEFLSQVKGYIVSVQTVDEQHHRLPMVDW
jgi:hypothetical protein